MATYEYDEAGVMAAYFLITFLALILVPITISTLTKGSVKSLSGCECQPCVDQRKLISKRSKGTIFNPNYSKKTYFLIGGWSLFAFVCYKVAGTKTENQVYDPFEILGLSSSTTEKDIKSHFKKLSRMYHPDKVKATANETIEIIQDRFVKLTKAYKSLTDETIRENWKKYNNPDGPQRMSMGIALPKWIIEGKNNIWVLGIYGLVFGGALPAFVGRWWFGSRQKTKDGVNAQSAAAFFKSLKEESTIEEVLATLGKAYKWELNGNAILKNNSALESLEREIANRISSTWTEVRKIAEDGDKDPNSKKKRALVLLYAHLLRINIEDPTLQREQTRILLQSPTLLNSLLNVSTSRNWLSPTLCIMRLHAYLTQALPPSASDRQKFTQLPGIQKEDVDSLWSQTRDMGEVVSALEQKGDDRADEVKKALEKWGRIEIVDAAFKVIGERIVTPSSIAYLVVKLRISPPGVDVSKKDLSVDETKRIVKANEIKDEQFLTFRGESEELPTESKTTGMAHAPYWPGERKPSWWIVLADDKSNRVVVPPFKITDIPFARPDVDRDYRSYKIQFQSPPNAGLYTWKIYLVSDTFVGEEVTNEIQLKIEEPTNADDQPSDDEISDPDEDTLAGQMAAMRGGKVKKHVEGEEDSDEESSTDDDKDSGDDSDSDSD